MLGSDGIMDVQTTQAIEGLGARMDRLEAEMTDGFAGVRAEIADLREDVRTGLESNWSRTQTLFESLRGDVQLLAGHVADLASRKSR